MQANLSGNFWRKSFGHYRRRAESHVQTYCSFDSAALSKHDSYWNLSNVLHYLYVGKSLQHVEFICRFIYSLYYICLFLRTFKDSQSH